MLSVYHAEFDTDQEAIDAFGEMQDACHQNGYDLQVSRSFGHGKAVLVLVVPSGTDPHSVGEHEWAWVKAADEEVVEETKTVPVTHDDENV
jgi:hypothetical protein